MKTPGRQKQGSKGTECDGIKEQFGCSPQKVQRYHKCVHW